ncbi:hypothetical protein G9A89_022548 [Geosiphon pyriformis]|nr:hypothetical protein G9A89_022548 [Geosiphon pyriformis]
MNRVKSKKVVNITFSIVTNKVLTRESLSVIETAKQNVLATFFLKNSSKKLPLVASGSFPSPLADSSSSISLSVVSTAFKSPKIFNNRPVNKLVFSALTTFTTIFITTASQIAAKAKNSKKQQQTVTTAMVTPNCFVVPDEIFSKISIVAASSFPDINSNSSSTSLKMGQDQPLAVLSDVVLSGRSSPIPVAKQSINSDDLKDWADQIEMKLTVFFPVSGTVDSMASNLVPNTTFKIKMALLSSLFQSLPGCIGLKSVLQDAVKLFCVEFASQESLNDATKVAISNEILLTIFKIAQSSDVASVSSPSLLVVLHDIPLGTSSNDIKTTLGIFGVVTSVKLKPADLWQYTMVNFEDIFSIAAVLSNWSVLVRKNSIRILLIANQKKVISLKDAFKAKLVNFLFSCIVFKISDLVSQVGDCTCFIPCFSESYQHQCFAVVTFDSLKSLNVAVSKTETSRCYHYYRYQDLNHLAVNCKKLPLFPSKLSFNTFGGPKNFKSSFVRSKSYAKAAAFVVPSGAAAADMDLDLGSSFKTATFMFPAVPSASNSAVKSRLAFLESHLSELSVLIKSLVESVGALVALVTKLLSTLSAIDVSVKECVCLKNGFDVDDMVDNVDDNDDNNKNFSVYNNTFDVMIHLWEDQPSKIKSSSDQTAKWMSDMIKNSHKLVSIMGKMYELDMFDILDSKDSTSI